MPWLREVGSPRSVMAVPSGQHQHRDPRARGVDHAAERIGGAGQRVHHHRLGLTCDHGVAVGHRHRGDLVGHGDRSQAARTGPVPAAWRTLR